MSVVSLAAVTVPLASSGMAAAQEHAADEECRVLFASDVIGNLRLGVEPYVETSGYDQSDSDLYAAFWSAGYEWADLQYLMEEWNLGQYEAKADAGEMIVSGHQDSLDALLDKRVVCESPFAESEGWSEADTLLYTAYWDAGYDYEQLKMLGTEWNLGQFETKALAGQLIVNRGRTQLDRILESAEPVEDCA